MDKPSELRLHGLKQFFVRLTPEQKNRKLTDLLDALEFNQTIIFVSKVSRAEELCRLLKECSFPATTVNSGIKDQAERCVIVHCMVSACWSVRSPVFAAFAGTLSSRSSALASWSPLTSLAVVSTSSA